MADSENDGEAGGAESNDAHFRLIPPEGDPDVAPDAAHEEEDATQPDLFSGSGKAASGKASHAPDAGVGAPADHDAAPLPLGGPGPPDNRLAAPPLPESTVPESTEPESTEPGFRTLQVSDTRAEDVTGGEAGPDVAADSESVTADSTFEMRTADRPPRSRPVPTKQIRPDAPVDRGDSGEPAAPLVPPSVPNAEMPPAVAGEAAPLIRVIADGDPSAGMGSAGREPRGQVPARRTETEALPGTGAAQDLPEPIRGRSGVLTKVITGLVFGAVALAFILVGRYGLAALAVLLITWVGAEVFVLLYRVTTPALHTDRAQTPSRRTRAVPVAVGVVAPDAEAAEDQAHESTQSRLEVEFDWGGLLARSPFLVGVAAVAALGILAYLYGIEAVGILTAAGSLAVVLWFYRPGERPTVPLEQSMALTGILHVGLLGAFALLILRLQHGFALLLTVVILVIVFDVASYAWGTVVGRRPLMPDISPNKTLEGLIGGVATTFVAMAVVVILPGSWYEVPFLHTWSDMAVFTTVLVVFGFLGDLAESLVKRSFGIKDVASFLPGHGGMFDRFDSILFALPAVYAVLVVLGVTE